MSNIDTAIRKLVPSGIRFRQKTTASGGLKSRAVLAETENKALQKQLSVITEQSRFDVLIPEALNRKAFSEDIVKRLNILSGPEFRHRASDNPHAGLLAFIDIDYFKAFVNDTYGHSVGDDFLKSFFLSLQESLRNNEDKIGRLGGEEFGLWLEGSSPELLEQAFLYGLLQPDGTVHESIYARINRIFAEKYLPNILDHTGKPISLPNIEEHGLPTYFSVGLSSVSSTDILDGSEMIRYTQMLSEADLDMYADKMRRHDRYERVMELASV